MFIREAEFENFENFLTGMGIYYIHFDFSKMKNLVCIIIGPNGVGKTSLLSYLTPFASIGTLDVREGNKMIISGKDGYKRIVFIDEYENEFEIEHFYTYSKSKDSYTSKSYIKRNGVELNENGNVTSFKDIVYEYLDVDITFLKLIRIGSNVSNLIKAKATERKTFMGKILEDVDWYLKQYKNVSMKERELNVLMNHTIDQLSKTNVQDVKESEKEIKDLEKRLNSLDKEIIKVNEQYGAIKYKIQDLDIPEHGNRELSDRGRRVDKLEKALQDSKFHSNDEVQKLITSTDKKVVSLEVKVESTSTNISNYIKTIGDIRNNIRSIEDSIQKEEESLNLKSVEDYLNNRRKELNFSFKQAFIEVPITCTKDEFEEFYVKLKNIQQQLRVCYEYGKEPIREVIKLMRKKEDIPQIINASLIAIESQEDKEKMFLIDSIIRRYVGLNITCKEECPLKTLQKELQDIKDTTPVTNVKFTSEFYQMMKLAYGVLSSVFKQLSELKVTVKKLPQDIQAMFTIDSLCNHICNTEFIFDQKILNELHSFLSERQRWIDLKEEVKKLEEDFEKRKEKSRVDYLNSELKKENKKLEEQEESFNEARNSLSELEDELAKERVNLESYKDLSDALLHLEDEKNAYEDLKNRLSLQDNLFTDLQKTESNRSGLLNLKEHMTSELFQKKSNLERYVKLTKELEIQRLTYEDYVNLKFATSNSTGVPIELIEDYLKETVDKANEIIDVAYHGDLRLKKFELTESYFKMPYEKNGKVIDDVISASQGEESFFNLAISTALRSQSMTRFNIGLFDEVDGVFDDDNRQHFIPVLEKTLELSGINQSFLITHNLMFSQYPVDTIDLGNLDNSTIKIDYK